MVSASTLLKFILGVKDIVIDQWGCTNNQDGIAELHIWLHPTARAKNRCPVCGRRCSVYDGSESMRSWRALYALGKAPEHLTEKQEARLAEIALSDKRLYRAYVLKEKLRLIIHMHDVEEARHALQRFFWSATHSRIKEFRELAYKTKKTSRTLWKCA